MIYCLPKARAFYAAFASALSIATVLGQDADVSHQRQVYRQINAGEPKMQQAKASVRGSEGKVSLTGWFENGKLRKIETSPGISGPGSDELYLDQGNPVFVFSRIDKANAAPTEERIYFAGGKIVKWLSSDPSFVPHGEDCESMEIRVAMEVPRYAAALGLGAKAKNNDGGTIEGVFTGIEQSDYAHWKLREDDGTERSFFIMNTDGAIERVLADPQEYEGRACTIRWERRTEEIPEAGGTMDIDILLGVTWK